MPVPLCRGASSAAPESGPAIAHPPARRIGLVLGASATALVILIAATLLLRTPGPAPSALQVDVTSSGGNWTLEVRASEALPTDRIYFLTRTAGGQPFSPLTPLADLSGFYDGPPAGILSAGDAIVLPQSEFPSGLTYWLLGPDRLLAAGTLMPGP